MQSCERSDSADESITEPKQQSIIILKNRESAKNAEEAVESKESDNFETGDDDEPKRDKQHWRMGQDTIR